MHILALSGSLRVGSTNTALLHAAAALAPAGVTLKLYQRLAALPFFMPGGYDEPAPLAVTAFREQLRAADALLICTPEYVHSMPGVLKNALEWLVASGELRHKPAAVWSASPAPDGGSRAHAGVVALLATLEARLVPAAALQISQAPARVHEEGIVTDPALTTDLRAAVAALAAAAR